MSSNDENNKQNPSDDLKKSIDLWLKWDQCEETRKEIEQLKSNSQWGDLDARLSQRIHFGTAGLRGKMGAGFSLMNELTVVQATQGLLRHIQTAFKDHQKPLAVVIAFDARHQSHQFARLAAALFAHEQFHVYLFDSMTVPTPVLSFAVQKLQCQAGLMITASHNPKEDNGYKVYWNNGAQIISPIDVDIAKSIENNLEPWSGKAWQLNILNEKDSKLLTDPKDKIMDLYMSEVVKLSYFPESNAKSALKFVYTPVHGVGQPYAERAFAAFKFPPFISVPEQKDPDPEFSTVKFPNPEEGKDTLACAIRTANENQADFILSTDPDADRFALAEREVKGDNQSDWRIFTGNQIGALLGWWRWFTWRNANPDVDVKDVYMLYSTVSSHILKSMGEVEGFNTIETLTGFKWIGNKCCELLKDQKHVLFAFEESIGYMCDAKNVLDKDGICAMCVGAEMCVYLHSIGRNLYEQLNTISMLYGYHINIDSYLFCNKTDVLTNIFHRLRHFDEHKDRSRSNAHEEHHSERKTLVQYSNRIKSHLGANEDEVKTADKDGSYVYPKNCGQYTITGIRDLTVGIEADFRGEGTDKEPSLPCSASNEMITFYFDNGCEVTIRASGTEPKIKWYSEIRKKKKNCEPTEDNPMIDDEQFRQKTKEELEELLRAVIQEFLQPEANELHGREETAK